MRDIDIRQMSRDLQGRIEEYEEAIEKIGFVCQCNTNKEKRAVWVKVGYRQRIEELKKTQLAITAIEAQILNDGYFDLPGYEKRIKRSASHIYGKGASLQYNGRNLIEYEFTYNSKRIPF